MVPSNVTMEDKEFWEQPDGAAIEYPRTTTKISKQKGRFLDVVASGGLNQQSTQRIIHYDALFILGDSSLNCKKNGFLYNFLHDRSSTYSCSGFQAPLLPDLLGDKMGFPLIPPFYAQNGTIEGLLSGLNFGSAQATIMNTGSLGFQLLNHQLRQLFETLQILQLQLGHSSVFYISLGKDDYIQLSGAIRKYGGGGFAHILVKQMIPDVKDLYNANTRKIVCMGIGPLGCAPRSLWEAYNSCSDDRSYCVEEMNELLLQYNTMLSQHLLDLNYELLDAQVIFCDVYQGMIEIINDPSVPRNDRDHKRTLQADVRIVSSLPSTHLVARRLVEQRRIHHDVSPQWIRTRLFKHLPSDLQKLRCKVAFHALRFVAIREIGNKLVSPYIPLLHLRLEKNVWVRTGCSTGLGPNVDHIIAQERESRPEFLTGRLNMSCEQRKFAGLCPLNALEVARMFKLRFL